MKEYRTFDVHYEDIGFDKRGVAAWITINRERRGNSFRRQTLDEICDALIRAGEGPGIRCVVLTAAGNRFFSTGGDVGDYHQRYSDDMIGMRSYERALEKTFGEIIHCPKPVINRINGDVVGGANAFHLACDYAVMARTAKLQQVGVGIGSVAGFGPVQWWPTLVNDKRARDILMSLKPVTSELAEQWGVVNVVCESDQLDAEVDKAVANYARMFPDALRYTKVALNVQKELAFREMTQAREWLTLHFPSMESRAGFGAFFDKRPVSSENSWKAVDTGHVTVAPYGGYSVICPSCGAHDLPEDFGYCGMCGAHLKKESA
ncbi:MAG: enoyl-CoA hydratase/isomerase family protein [Proteobacteria bacterium]|nr:enoyl-CoA hydratase/isomerase family protein [Pseudomonadota bacterium]